MILHTSAHCITDPPCEWTGNTDRSAAKHGRETGHATIVETVPVKGNGAPGSLVLKIPLGITASFDEIKRATRPTGGAR